MKFIQLFFFSLIAATAFAELEVTSVKIKQNWPWSHKVYIDCTISGVEERVDLSIKAYNGGTEISLPEDAITGPRYCLENDGTYRLTLDPIVAFGKGTKWMSSFKVDVTVAPSSEKSKEIFYKIFDFETKTVTDVTRGRLLNGEFGAFEKDYSKIDESFKTPLSDVLIWTGVTNYPGAKTTKLVMRRIPAGNGYYRGSMTWSGTWYTITVSQPFYIGVFELTQKQYSYFGTHLKNGDYYNPESVPGNVGDSKPLQNFGVQKVLYKDVRVWDASRGSLKNLKDYFLEAGTYNFHLPTQCMWYRAAFAESKTYYYDGIAGAPENFDYNERMAKLGRFAGNGGMTYNDDGSIITNGTVEVGMYKPNAFGLYDVLGNVYEATHDDSVKWAASRVDELNSTGNTMGIYGGSYRDNSQLWPQPLYETALHSVKKHPYVGVRLAFFEDINPYVVEEEPPTEEPPPTETTPEE
jgi:formylglycine-generating enzyme required for sulfatase activity